MAAELRLLRELVMGLLCDQIQDGEMTKQAAEKLIDEARQRTIDHDSYLGPTARHYAKELTAQLPEG